LLCRAAPECASAPGGLSSPLTLAERAGSLAAVHFQLPAGTATLRLPSNTLLFRPDGEYVATADGTAAW
jgi:hypothetical protein